MARTFRQGTRQAPIIIDDDEEEDDIAFVAGPSRLAPNPPNAQTRLPEIEFKVSHPTSTVPNYSKSASNPTFYMPNLGVSQPIAREADVPRDDQPCLDTAPPEPPILGLMPGPLTLKRKRNLQDTQGPTRTPLPPLSSFFIPVPPDPFAGLSKKQRKRLRKRLRAEQEAKSRIAVPKISKPSPLAAPIPLPDKPASVALPADKGNLQPIPYSGPKSCIPGQEFASPSYVSSAAAPLASQPAQDASSATHNSRAASIQAHPLPPKPPSSNAFGPSTRPIGRHTLPGLGFGLFPVSPDQYVSHDPVRTLVLENLPKRFRSIEFVLQWCRDIKLASDPDPLHVDVMRKLGKALVEFATPAQATRAFSSPKLANSDGRDQIIAYWFSPLTSIPAHSCTAAQLPSRPAPSPPVFPSADQQSSALSTRPVRGVSPSAPLHVDPFMPYLRPMHYPQSFHASSLEGNTVPPPKDAPYPTSHLNSDNSLRQDETNEYEGQDGEEVEEGEILEVEQTCSVTEDHGEPREYSTISPSPKKKSTRSSPEREYSCIELVASGHGLSRLAQVDVMECVEDEKVPRRRRETPQPVPTSSEIFGSIASSAAGPLTELEPRVAFASLLLDETTDAMDVDHSAISLPPDLDDPRPDPQFTSSVPPRLPVAQKAGFDGVVQQPSGPVQHDQIPQVISDATTAEGKGGSSRDTKHEPLSQSLSQKLSELRERVLATKKRRTETQEVSASFHQKANTSPGTTVPNSITSGDADMSSAQTLNLSIMSTLASDSAESLFSSASLASSSMSSVGEDSIPKSASYINNLADALLEDILGPAKIDSSAPSRNEAITPSLGNPLNATTITQKQEERVREHLAKAKALLVQWETAGSKSEKTRIWTLLKEEERSFEAEKAAVDAQLKQLETRKLASSRAGRRSFGKWPQTNPDEMILILSDNEDDGSV